MMSRRSCVLPILLLSALIGSVFTIVSKECCVENAVYNPRTKLCECVSGYEGLGHLCCKPKEGAEAKDICLLSGDPFLTSINGVVIPLNSPCAVCLNVMEGQTDNGQACVLEVLGSSNIVEHGGLYNDMLNVGVKVKNQKAKYFRFLEGKISNTETGEELTLGAGNTLTTDVHGTAATFSYDGTRGLWSMTVCGNQAVFRPSTFNKTMCAPGVCMLAGKGSTTRTINQGNLCNVKQDFTANKKDLPYAVFNSAIQMRARFDQNQLKSHPDFDQTCKEKVDDLFQGFCQGFELDAMKKCGPVLYQSVIRDCLYETGTQGNDILDLFATCLAAFCDGESMHCNSMKEKESVKKCIPSLTKCNTWDNYFEF